MNLNLCLSDLHPTCPNPDGPTNLSSRSARQERRGHLSLGVNPKLSLLCPENGNQISLSATNGVIQFSRGKSLEAPPVRERLVRIPKLLRRDRLQSGFHRA